MNLRFKNRQIIFFTIGLILIFSGRVLAQVEPSTRRGKGLYFRILKQSENKRVFLMNRGREESLRHNDHINIFFNKQKLAKAKLEKLAPTRSIWHIFEFYNRDQIQVDQVYYFELIDPVKFVQDTTIEEPQLTIEDQIAPEDKFHPSFYRFEFLLGLGTRSGSQYRYSSGLNGDPHGQQYNLQLVWSQYFHEAPKFYWGLLASALLMRNHFLLSNLAAVQEQKTVIGLGPYLGHDLYSTQKQRLVAYFSTVWNPLHTVVLSQTLGVNRDEVKFTGKSFSSILGLKYQRLDIFKDINLLAAINARLNYSHRLKSSDELPNTGLWTAREINNRRSTDVEYLVGLQYPY